MLQEVDVLPQSSLLQGSIVVVVSIVVDVDVDVEVLVEVDVDVVILVVEVEVVVLVVEVEVVGGLLEQYISLTLTPSFTTEPSLVNLNFTLLMV